MSTETRHGLEFGSLARKGISRKTQGKCIITGSKRALERHHIIPIWAAHEYLGDFNPGIIKSSINGVLVRADVHTELHEQMDNWPEWALINYIAGYYAYAEEQYYKSAVPELVPEWVGHRKLTDNKLVDIYVAATGD